MGIISTKSLTSRICKLSPREVWWFYWGHRKTAGAATQIFPFSGLVFCSDITLPVVIHSPLTPSFLSTCIYTNKHLKLWVQWHLIDPTFKKKSICTLLISFVTFLILISIFVIISTFNPALRMFLTLRFYFFMLRTLFQLASECLPSALICPWNYFTHFSTFVPYSCLRFNILKAKFIIFCKLALFSQ